MPAITEVPRHGEIPQADLLSVPVVAVRFGCSVETVRRMIRSGKLTAVKLSDRSVRVSREEVERYAQANGSDAGAYSLAV